MKTIEWNEPTSGKTGRLICTSKCGLFTITHRFSGYVLESPSIAIPEWALVSNSLLQAKDSATELASDKD